jgi:hypothetical protein
MTRSQRKVTHFALDPTWISSAAAGGDLVLEDFLQYVIMKRFAQLRGE